MPRKFFKRITPDTHTLREHKYLKFFGELLHNENLWHINRNSVSLAFGIGFFTAMLPLPFHMVIAAALAILLHANLPLSVLLVWVNNPLTMPPIFYSAYKLGSRILGVQPMQVKGEISLQWITSEISRIWQPLFLGSLIIATLSGFLAYWIVRRLWRIRVLANWKKRSESRG